MAHTYSIDHVVTTTESVNIEVAAKSEMVLVSSDKIKDGFQAVYVLSSGDFKYPATVTYRVQNELRAGLPVARLSVSFDTWAADDDGVSTVVRKPINGTISFLVPADLTVELGDIDDFLGNLISFCYASVTAGARSTTYLQKLLYGSPQVV